MIPSRSTFVCSLILFLLGWAVGTLQVESMPGMPMHGRYHASDMDDLQQQLLGYSARPQEYAAGADHPAWYAICAPTALAFGSACATPRRAAARLAGWGPPVHPALVLVLPYARVAMPRGRPSK